MFDHETLSRIAEQSGLPLEDVRQIADDVEARGDSVANPAGLLVSWVKRRKAQLSALADAGKSAAATGAIYSVEAGKMPSRAEWRRADPEYVREHLDAFYAKHGHRRSQAS